MKRIVIIGANSFLAQNFYTYLTNVHQSIEIYLYDIQEFFSLNKSIYYQQIDFFSIPSIEKINFDVDYIYFFIGKTGTTNGFEEYKTFIKLNEEILLNVLNVYRSKKSNACLVYPSTRLVYKSSKLPVDENAIKELKSVYAITKYAAENYIQMYHHAFGLNYVIFRLSVPWGTLLEKKVDSYGTFKIFTEQAIKNKEIMIYGDGSDLKTYTYIEDVCKVMFSPIVNNMIYNDIYNIGGKEYSLNEVVEVIAHKYSSKIVHIKWPKISESVDGGSTILKSHKLDLLFPINYRKIEEIEF